MNLLPNLTFDLWSILLLIGCLHGWFLFLVLAFSSIRLKLILGTLIFLFSYNLFMAFLWQSGWMIHFPHLLASSMPTMYLVGPLYYWFFSALLEDKQHLKWWHFLPSYICLLTIVPFYLQPVAFKINYILSKDVSVVDLPPTRAVYFGLLLVQLTFYWILTQRLSFPGLDQDRRKNQIIRRMGNWLKVFHYAFGIFMVVFLATYLLLTIGHWNYGEIRYMAQLSLAFLVHIIGYYTIKYSLVFPNRRHSGAPDNPNIELKPKILHTMEVDKPFLDQDLTLAKFSESLKASPSVVSRVINQEFQCNFSDFINQYRVDEAKKLVLDSKYQHYKLEAIGQEAGFSNKGSFNRVFKKHTGNTPSSLRTTKVTR